MKGPAGVDTISGNEIGAKILVVDDVAENRRVLLEMLEAEGYSVSMAPSGEVALKVAGSNPPDLVLLDVMMPGMDGTETCRRLHTLPGLEGVPVIFVTAKGELSDLVEGFDAGGVDYVRKPVKAEEVLMRVRTHVKIYNLKRELERQNEVLAEEIRQRKRAEKKVTELSKRELARWGVDGHVGQSHAYQTAAAEIQRLTKFTRTNVLIAGESGTGKELVARAIHFGSELQNNPFIAVNCAAVPRELAESSFFGHVKGSFSGAVSNRPGYFQEANGGSLFLDEIGDMPLELQGKLLRVLEEGVVLPVGSAKERAVKVRVLAATNADLRAQVEGGQFRKDLYFRIAGYEIELKPLRERDGDVSLLAEHFLHRFTSEMGLGAVSLSSAALEKLEGYDYPGNIRELKNLIERSLIESGGGEIRPEHIRFQFDSTRVAQPPGGGKIPSMKTAHPYREGSDEAQILDYVSHRGSVNNADCRDLLGVGLHRACYLLRKLHRDGVLQRDNSRKSAVYRMSEPD